jgi:hypothetical protein
MNLDYILIFMGGIGGGLVLCKVLSWLINDK